MGNTGTRATTTVDTLTEVAVNVAQQTVNTCRANTNQLQEVNISYTLGDVRISGLDFRQSAAIDMNCALSAEKQNEIRNNIANEIAQQAAAQGQAVLSLLGSTQADATTNIRNLFGTNISQRDFQESASSINQVQRLNIAGTTGNVILSNTTFDQTARVVAAGIINTASYSDAITTVANVLDQGVQAEEENPLSFITDIFRNISTTTGLVIGAIVIVILLIIFGPIIYLIYASRKKKGGEPDMIDVFGGLDLDRFTEPV